LYFQVGGGISLTFGTQVPPEIVTESTLTEPWLPTQPDTAAHVSVVGTFAQACVQAKSSKIRSSASHT